MSEQERRESIGALLMPADDPVGAPGRRRGIRLMPGGLDAARGFLRQFEEIGRAEEAERYDGVLINLGGEDRVGLRERSRSGEPTIDVQVQWLPERGESPTGKSHSEWHIRNISGHPNPGKGLLRPLMLRRSAWNNVC